MLRLTNSRLINWYHYVDETIPVRGNTLLCGDNGSGKTTILDAVQLALVGNEKMCEFNRAAQNQMKTSAKRSVVGYVRYQTDEENGSRLSFNRDAGTTGYVMLEFRDPDHPERDFTCGVVLDTKDTSVNKAGFVFPKRGVADVPAVTDDDTVRPSRDFKAIARQMGFKVTDDVGVYQDDLRHRLGRVPEHFHRLIVKALEFKPMATVKDFVLKYLAERKDINSQPLLENIRHYREMDRAASDAEVKIGLLSDICRLGESIQRDRQTLMLYDYLVLRAKVDEHQAVIDQEETALANAMSARERAEEKEKIASEKEEAYRRREQQLRDEINKSPAHRRVQQLKDDLEQVEQAIRDAADKRKSLSEVAAQQLTAMDAITSPQTAVEVRRRRPDLFPESSDYGLREVPERLNDLKQRLREDEYLLGRDLHAWEVRSETVTEQLQMAKARLELEGKALKEEGSALALERKELDQGRLVFPEGARGLIEHLRKNLGGVAPVRVLCELIEVPNERWRDAVEMQLGARRLYVLVDPQDYDRASEMYKRFRRAGNRVWGTGIVDVAKVHRDRRRAQPNSLAEQVESDDPAASAYINYLLGDVICVDDVRDLRKHNRAITDTGETYGGAAMSNADPRNLDRRYIGRAAKQRRLDEIDARLKEITETMTDINDVGNLIGIDLKHFQKARASLRRMEDLSPSVARLPEMKAEAEQIKKHIKGIDLGDKADLDAQLSEAVFLVEEAAKAAKEAAAERGAIGNNIIQIGDRLKDRRTLVAAARAEWRQHFPVDRIDDVVPGAADDPWREFAARYAEERKARSPEGVGEVFAKQQKSFGTKIQNQIEELIKLKADFNAKHYVIVEPLNDGFGEYRAQRIVWEESKLPEYRAEIAKAQAQAVRHMGEDIVCKLHENFAQLRQDVRELNAVLRDLDFGNDKFEFRMDVATSKQAYYDVIMRTAAQPMSSASDPEMALFDGQQRPLDSLTDDLTRLVHDFLRAQDEKVKTDLEEITDYREYFTYDLKITNKVTGKGKSYNFVAGTGSGGEVQSALYIAFLASMYQMYRANTRDRRPQAATVLLDEAFGKNDGKRIAATLRFARSFGLQLILAMPAERMDLLGPLMDTTIFLHKDAATGVPSVVDFSKQFDDDVLLADTLAKLEEEGGSVHVVAEGTEEAATEGDGAVEVAVA